MDHFESIISTLLEAEHHWVRRSFKVIVTKEEKRRVKKHSIPRRRSTCLRSISPEMK